MVAKVVVIVSEEGYLLNLSSSGLSSVMPLKYLMMT